MATMVTAQEITLENLHEHLEFRVVDEADGVVDFGICFEFHWDRTNEQLHKLMASEFSNNLDAVNNKKSMMWVADILRYIAEEDIDTSWYQRDDDLFLAFDFFEDGHVFVGAVFEGSPRAPLMKIGDESLVSMRMCDNYSTDPTDTNSFYVRVLSLYNDQVRFE
jgi:hypothetical protein